MREHDPKQRRIGARPQPCDKRQRDPVALVDLQRQAEVEHKPRTARLQLDAASADLGGAAMYPRPHR